MVGIGLQFSLGENPTPCFISSGKNATSVQKQPKTLYEWNPLNYNISEFPKAVNRISCIVEEVLNTYMQTHRLFGSGSCSSEHVIRPGILLAQGVVPLFPENTVQLFREEKGKWCHLTVLGCL